MEGCIIRKPYRQKDHEFFVNRLQGFSKIIPNPRNILEPITETTEQHVKYNK